MERLSLRLRIFLFFVLLGFGGVALILGAGWMGYRRALSTTLVDGFVIAGLLSGFGLLALVTGVWLLFDENIAKPIERLAAGLRAGVHSGVSSRVDLHAARHLGDLAPAAKAVSGRLSASMLETAGAIAEETDRLRAEKERLTALLSDIPVAMALVNPAHQIVLYDGQAGAVLAQVAPPRLNASVFDYFDSAPIEEAYARMQQDQTETHCTAIGNRGEQSFDLRLKPLEASEGYMLILEDSAAQIAPDAARPLVYDFDLLERAEAGDQDDLALSEMCFMVFDSETTGLMPHKDDVVQIGAVRVLRGRIVDGEEIDQLVDPGRAIPPASTKVHGITDAMVEGAPDIATVGRILHQFSQGAVIVAHNAPFDMAFLHRHADEMGVVWDHPILDTVLLSAVVFGASDVHTLDALCERLDITIPEALRHTALGDAHATAKVLCRLIPLLEARGLTRFSDVIAQTRKHGRLLQDLN